MQLPWGKHCNKDDLCFCLTFIHNQWNKDESSTSCHYCNDHLKVDSIFTFYMYICSLVYNFSNKCFESMDLHCSVLSITNKTQFLKWTFLVKFHFKIFKIAPICYTSNWPELLQNFTKWSFAWCNETKLQNILY